MLGRHDAGCGVSAGPINAFGSRLASLQYKEKAIMAAGGWTSSKAVQRYLHLYDESMKEAAERLSTLRPNGTVTETVMPHPSAVDKEAQVIEDTASPRSSAG